MPESRQTNLAFAHSTQSAEGAEGSSHLLSIETANIRKIATPTKAQDTLLKIQNGWLGNFYRRHFKQIFLVGRLVMLIWQTLHLARNRFVPLLYARASSKWRRLISLSEYVENTQAPTVKVFEVERINTPIPKVFPTRDQPYLIAPHDHYIFPSVYVAELKNALIHGGTNIVFHRDMAVCHDLYDFSRDYTSEELHGRHVIDADRMRMRLLVHDDTPEKLASAATFVDATSTNYAHWITEVLPRVAAFCTQDQFSDVPIVINDGLHTNIMESLVLIVGITRKIILLPIGRAIEVGRLYVTSVAGYVPFERRTSKLTNHSHGRFCPSALQIVRNRCISVSSHLMPQKESKKIYLRRISSGRNILNGTEVEDLFRDAGYVIIEPEKLSFIEQIALFSSASDIVGSSGAALANLIFAPPTARIRIFIGRFKDTSYWYWQNIACSSEKKIIYHLGAIERNRHGIHADFSIDIQEIMQALRTIK